jgi:hypothetical protein
VSQACAYKDTPAPPRYRQSAAAIHGSRCHSCGNLRRVLARGVSGSHPCRPSCADPQLGRSAPAGSPGLICSGPRAAQAGDRHLATDCSRRLRRLGDTADRHGVGLLNRGGIAEPFMSSAQIATLDCTRPCPICHHTMDLSRIETVPWAWRTAGERLDFCCTNCGMIRTEWTAIPFLAAPETAPT